MDRRTFLGTSLALPLAGPVAAGLAEVQNAATNEPAPPREIPGIRRCRDVALQILKPTDKQLQHGLELHANALVFDVYGFAPRAAVDGDGLKAAVEAGASDIELQDLTEDMSMTRCVTDPVERDEFLQAWESA